MDLQLFSVERAPRHLPIWPMIVDDLGRPSAKRLAKALDISERTARRYIASGTAPRAICMALYWLTRWGRSQLDADAVNDAAMAVTYATALKRERDYLRGQVNTIKVERDAWRERLKNATKLLEAASTKPGQLAIQGSHTNGNRVVIKAGQRQQEVQKFGLPGSVTDTSRFAEPEDRDSKRQPATLPSVPHREKKEPKVSLVRLPGRVTCTSPCGEPNSQVSKQNLAEDSDHAEGGPGASRGAPRPARPLPLPRPGASAFAAIAAASMSAKQPALESDETSSGAEVMAVHASNTSSTPTPAGQKAKASGPTALYWGQAPSPPQPTDKRAKNGHQSASKGIAKAHPWQRWPTP